MALSEDGTVVIDRRDEPRRYQCPRGHHDWAVVGDELLCSGCVRERLSGDREPRHRELFDTLRGRWVGVEDVAVRGR